MRNGAAVYDGDVERSVELLLAGYERDHFEDGSSTTSTGRGAPARTTPSPVPRCSRARRPATPIEPGVAEYKDYAPDIGLVLEVDPDTGERLELIAIIDKP